MGAPLYTLTPAVSAALSAGVARTILGIKSGATFGLVLKEWRVGFDGVTAGATPVLVELLRSTWATNSPGTASSAITPAQVGGRVLAHGITGGRDWTTEPTVLEQLEAVPFIHPQAGFIVQMPLGDEYDCDLAHGFVIRVTAPQAVNARGFLKWQRA